jgi:mono/diheme cytochrome c family protein
VDQNPAMTRSTVRRRLAASAAVAVTVGLIGCGGSSQQPPPSGQRLFAADCGACHSVSGIERPGRQGGDLRGLRIAHAAMLQFVREMPVRYRLTAVQTNAVAKYVLAIERAARKG